MTIGKINSNVENEIGLPIGKGEMEMKKCQKCNQEIRPLEEFPNGLCLECHAEVTPMPTAQELIEMWGGK